MKKTLILGLIAILSTLLLAPSSFAMDLDSYDRVFYQGRNANYSLVLLKSAAGEASVQGNIMLFVYNNEFFRLNPAYLTPSGLPRDPILPGNYGFSLKYEPDSNTITGEMEWLLSPDGSWGFYITDPILVHNSSEPVLVRICLFKNMKTGRIQREITAWGIYAPVSYYWLPDNTFLYCRYSLEDNQNIIGVYDPAATYDNPMTAFKEAKGSYNNKKLLNGTMIYYDRETNEVAFVKNESKRRIYLLDLNTMEEKPTDDFIENFRHSDYEMAPSLYFPPEIHLPHDLDVFTLPVISPKVDFKYQHLLHVDGKEIPLPMAYYSSPNSAYPSIPLRQLIDTYGVSFSINFNKVFKTISIMAPNGKQIGTWSAEAICPPVLIGTTAEEIGSNIYIYSEIFFSGLKEAAGMPEGEWKVTPLFYD